MIFALEVLVPPPDGAPFRLGLMRLNICFWPCFCSDITKLYHTKGEVEIPYPVHLLL